MSEGLGFEQADVVVVGGGMAALQAAIAATEAGAKVILVTRRRMGRSGSSAMTTGGFAAVLTDSDPADPQADHRDLHFEDTFHGGGEIADPELVRILCDEAPAAAAALERIGGAFHKRGGRYVLSGSGDHSRKRSLGATNHIGTDFTGPQAERARQLGVTALEFHTTIKVLTRDGAAAGVLAIDTRMARPTVVEAGAVVLAAGGAGQLFPVTSNPIEVTGGGYWLAAEAGADMRDMEFIQFYPWRCIDPFPRGRVSIQPATFTVGGRLYNSEGHRFMGDYDPERLEATTRDIAARAIFDQVRRGLGVGGGVRLDLSALDDETLAETNPKMARMLARSGIDHRTYPFVVAPEAHYFMGGAVIDAWGRTTVPLLYAAGETAGGVQGANRLSNNALPEALVFGERAGRDAARVVSEGDRVGVDPEQLGEALAGIDRTLARPRPVPFGRDDIQQTAWESLGIIRHAGALEAGGARFAELAATLDETGADGPEALDDWWDLRFLLEVARMSLTAATRRTESRGAHYREDHPQPDETWRGSLLLRRQPDGSYETSFRPAPALQKQGSVRR